MKAYYERPVGSGSRTDLRIAAVAASEGTAAALREAETLYSEEDRRKSAVRGAATFLLILGEYSKAAELLQEGGIDAFSKADLELLRGTHRRSEMKFSANPAIEIVQRYILALCDPHGGPSHTEFLVPEWRLLTFASQRNSLLSLLSAYARVADANATRPEGEIVVSNVQFVAEGDDATGYRVRFGDPSQNGAQKTIAWVVKRGNSYFVLGLRGDESTSGGEALALAEKGEIRGARRWLDWEREEVSGATSADPLASQPFLKLWPLRPEVSESDQILAAAASLALRGRHYERGRDVLIELRGKANDPQFKEAVDFALAQGLTRHMEFADAVPIWRDLWKRYPNSDTAVAGLGAALANSGQLDEALEFTGGFISRDAGYAAALRVRALVFRLRRQYAPAVDVLKRLCDTPKATADDWNRRAWLSLFARGVIEPDLEAAKTADRLTRQANAPAVHTLGSVEAEVGQLKEAHQMLVRYVSLVGSVNSSAQYLMGRIAEGLGLADAAAELYRRIPAPEHDFGETVYGLAQVRLDAMVAAGK
jgi:tetratricopeptide (TPR) repeat protein